eukprot:c36968_g1_i1 orf=224-607(-)
MEANLTYSRSGHQTVGRTTIKLEKGERKANQRRSLLQKRQEGRIIKTPSEQVIRVKGDMKDGWLGWNKDSIVGNREHSKEIRGVVVRDGVLVSLYFRFCKRAICNSRLTIHQDEGSGMLDKLMTIPF